MVGEVRIVYRLTAVLGGLCLLGLCLLISACATPPTVYRTVPPGKPAPAVTQEAPGQVPQDGASIPGQAGGAEVLPVPAPVLAPAAVLARIALLLPVQSGTLGSAAAAVQAGFMAAAERDANQAIQVETIPSGEAALEVLAAYGSAANAFDIVVGPLTRSGVSAIVQSGAVVKPTIALTQVDVQEEANTALPKRMLMMGLSIEDEARQMASLLHARKPVGTAIVLTTPTAWQQRAAKAFAERWQQLGYGSEVMELDISAQGTYLGANGLIQLQKRLQVEAPPFLFSALDAVQTRQLRLLIGPDIPVYGTSQLNPYTIAQWSIAEPLPVMNGVRLLDLPWLLQTDHPAVLAYSHAVSSVDHQRGADLERLYALGIDAFRVAKEIASGQSQFQIDGVTGKLRVNLDKPTGRFERIELPAVYRDGRVSPFVATQ